MCDASTITGVPLKDFTAGLTENQLIFEIAEKVRLLDEGRYGGTPFVGRGSVKPLIFPGVVFSSDSKLVSSGNEPIEAKELVKCCISGKQLYFLVTRNDLVDLTIMNTYPCEIQIVCICREYLVRCMFSRHRALH